MRELEFSMYLPLVGSNVVVGRENRLRWARRTCISRALLLDDKGITEGCRAAMFKGDNLSDAGHSNEKGNGTRSLNFSIHRR
jgi:hypothetical protein